MKNVKNFLKRTIVKILLFIMVLLFQNNLIIAIKGKTFKGHNFYIKSDNQKFKSIPTNTLNKSSKFFSVGTIGSLGALGGYNISQKTEKPNKGLQKNSDDNILKSDNNKPSLILNTEEKIRSKPSTLEKLLEDQSTSQPILTYESPEVLTSNSRNSVDEKEYQKEIISPTPMDLSNTQEEVSAFDDDNENNNNLDDINNNNQQQINETDPLDEKIAEIKIQSQIIQDKLNHQQEKINYQEDQISTKEDFINKETLLNQQQEKLIIDQEILEQELKPLLKNIYNKMAINDLYFKKWEKSNKPIIGEINKQYHQLNDQKYSVIDQQKRLKNKLEIPTVRSIGLAARKINKDVSFTMSNLTYKQNNIPTQNIKTKSILNDDINKIPIYQNQIVYWSNSYGPLSLFFEGKIKEINPKNDDLILHEISAFYFDENDEKQFIKFDDNLKNEKDLENNTVFKKFIDIHTNLFNQYFENIFAKVQENDEAFFNNTYQDEYDRENDVFRIKMDNCFHRSFDRYGELIIDLKGQTVYYYTGTNCFTSFAEDKVSILFQGDISSLTDNIELKTTNIHTEISKKITLEDLKENYFFKPLHYLYSMVDYVNNTHKNNYSLSRSRFYSKIDNDTKNDIIIFSGKVSAIKNQ